MYTFQRHLCFVDRFIQINIILKLIDSRGLLVLTVFINAGLHDKSWKRVSTRSVEFRCYSHVISHCFHPVCHFDQKCRVVLFDLIIQFLKIDKCHFKGSCHPPRVELDNQHE